jgi:acetyl esterase/lipase
MKGKQMPRLKISTWLSFLIVLTLLVASWTTVYAEYSLVFDPSICTSETYTTADGQTIYYRACLNIVYVSNPVDTTYQKMNIYVPEAYYYKGGSINGYTAKTAPIFFPMTVGGYNPGPPATIETSNTVQQALLRGYVVAAPGARGRTNTDPSGLYNGKAPACIVDVKAAVRYLRYNDKIMPGDTKKIIPNGTSASGALSSLLGATGNNKEGTRCGK